MTENEWKTVEKGLLNGLPVRLIIDGYEVHLILIRENMKLFIAVLVGGKFEFKWVEEDCEIRQRFMCPSKKYLISQKELNKMTRSKKKQKEIRNMNTHIWYSPYWTSFNRLKRHLIKNNNNIDILHKNIPIINYDNTYDNTCAD